MAEFDEDFIPETDEESNADVTHFKWTVTKTLTRRLDQYLVDRVGYLSRAGVQRVIKEGLVKANGRVVKSSYHPQNGDTIEMVAPPEPINELVPENIPLDILYEDEHFLALNKQADLIVHPARGKWTGTLVNGLVYYGLQTGFSLSSGGVRPGQLPDGIPASAGMSGTGGTKEMGNWRPGILHRLDRNTTGIMLIAKSEEAHWRLARQFENRTIQKTYIALCHGIPPLLSDIINAPIGKDKYIREKQAVRKIEAGGKEAVTLYEIQKTFKGLKDPATQISKPNRAESITPVSHGDPNTPHLLPRPLQPHLTSDIKHHTSAPPQPLGACCLVKLTPKTGRTHQLRVHMTSIQHPMVGDTIYGGREVHTETFSFARQALHAYEITFTHPATLKPMTLTAPLPPDFTTLMSLLEPT